jgi:RsmE family RNA methyltransferase
MKIADPVQFEDVLSQKNLYALDIGGESWAEPVEPIKTFSLMIGPEAGWSDVERQRLIEQEIPRIGLSIYHLRMETAATIGAARLLEGNRS